MTNRIGEDSGAWRETPCPPVRPEVVVLSASDDEESPDAIDVVQPFEVVVATVEDVEGVFFVGYRIHRLHVVDLGWGDVKEGGYLRLNVIQRVYFDATLPFPEQGPVKDAEAEVNGSGIESVDITSQLEDLHRPALPCLGHHAICKFLEDAIVAVAIRLG